MAGARRDRRMISVREFRDTFSHLQESVIVVRSRQPIEILGTWTPTPKRVRENRTPEPEQGQM